MWQIRRFIFMLSCHLLLVYANDSIESPASSQVANSFNIPTCNEKGENLNDCLLKVFNEIIPRCKDGIPEINVPPMDPFVINKTSFIFSHPLVQGKIAVRNVKVYGLSKITTKRVDYRRKGDQVTVRFKAFIPEMFVEGTYKAKIKINNVNIASKGPFNATFTNIDLDSESLSDLYKKDGHRYMRLRTFTVDPNVGNMKVNAEGLLPEPLLMDDITNCQKYFGPCLRQVLSNVVPKLKDAYKFLNIPSLDPIYFNATAFQYNSGPFTGYITIRYALIYGLTTMKFKKVDFNKQNEKFKARFTLLVPKMSAIGSYKGDMHVNNVRVRPRGDFNITMTGMGVDMVALGAVIEKDEHKFLRLTKSNATTSLKDSKINATGIFPDQRLNEIVVNVANQYWRDLFNIVLPETRNNWLPILTNALNAALAMVPFDFFK